MNRTSKGNLSWFVICLLIGCWIGLCIWGWLKPPTAPVECSFRRSLLADGYVLQVRNKGDVQLSCRAEMVNIAGTQQVKYPFTVVPGKREEIGVLECKWNFESSEQVTLFIEGYRTLSITVP